MIFLRSLCDYLYHGYHTKSLTITPVIKSSPNMTIITNYHFFFLIFFPLNGEFFHESHPNSESKLRFKISKLISNRGLIKKLVANMELFHTCFFILIKIEAKHISGIQAKVVKILTYLLFSAFVVSLTMPDFQFNYVLLSQVIDYNICYLSLRYYCHF